MNIPTPIHQARPERREDQAIRDLRGITSLGAVERIVRTDSTLQCHLYFEFVGRDREQRLCIQFSRGGTWQVLDARLETTKLIRNWLEERTKPEVEEAGEESANLQPGCKPSSDSCLQTPLFLKQRIRQLNGIEYLGSVSAVRDGPGLYAQHSYGLDQNGAVVWRDRAQFVWRVMDGRQSTTRLLKKWLAGEPVEMA